MDRTRTEFRDAFLAIGLLGLASCAGGGEAAPTGTIALDCVPFARALSGIRLSGDAASWWREADGRYQRATTPAVGSVLVFRRSDRLPYGHVGVVSSVVSSWEITLAQANWVHRRITVDQQAVDVSAANDWSLVRVFWPPSARLGTTLYPTYGFIRPTRPATTQEIAANIRRAATQR